MAEGEIIECAQCGKTFEDRMLLMIHFVFDHPDILDMMKSKEQKN
jgi:hypothetical protein